MTTRSLETSGTQVRIEPEELVTEQLRSIYYANGDIGLTKLPDKVPIEEYKTQVNTDIITKEFQPFILAACTTGIEVTKAIVWLTNLFGWIDWGLVLADVVIVGLNELIKIIQFLCEYKIEISIIKRDDDLQTEEPNEFDPENDDNADPSNNPPEDVLPTEPQQDEEDLVILIDDEGYLLRTDGVRFLQDGNPILYTSLDPEILEQYSLQPTQNSNLVFSPFEIQNAIDIQVNDDIPPEEEESFPVITRDPTPETEPPEQPE